MEKQKALVFGWLNIIEKNITFIPKVEFSLTMNLTKNRKFCVKKNNKLCKKT